MNFTLELLKPPDGVEFFQQLSRELLAVLQSLRTEDWARPTACRDWSVKDAAAHLPCGNLGRLWNRLLACGLCCGKTAGGYCTRAGIQVRPAG